MSRRQQLVDSIKLKALDALPKNVVSRAFGAISEVALPTPIQGVVNQGFASLYNLNTSEAERKPGEWMSSRSCSLARHVFFFESSPVHEARDR